jgi:two-component system, chemotaxis family, chemotaxis protein CheV
MADIVSSTPLTLLLFRIPGRPETYGLNVFKTQEIRAELDITSPPGLPAFATGISLLRDELLTVLDLGAMLYPQDTRTTIAQPLYIVARTGGVPFAFLIEEVKRIESMPSTAVSPYPEVGGGNTPCAMGIALLQEEIIVILDTDAILARAGISAPTPTAQAVDSRLALRGTTVLYVEDSALARKQTLGFFQQLGINPLVAKDGQEAIELLNRCEQNREPISAVLTDVEMPRLNGYDLTTWIKQHRHWRATPVIIYSGLSSAGNQQQSLKAGANAYIPKFALVDVAEALESAIFGK